MSWAGLARMAAEVFVVETFGPDATIDSFSLDGVEIEPDAIHVTASVRVAPRLDQIAIRLVVS